MSTITLPIPDNIELDTRDTIKFLAGLSKVAFSEILIDYNVSLFNYPASDIKKDASRI